MPSLSSTLQSQAFTTVGLYVNGEALQFRGATITGIVDRDPGKAWKNGILQRDNYTFTENKFSVIELSTDAVNPLPAVGEAFTDDRGYKHRVQQTDTGEFSISCKCEVVKP